MIVPFFITPKSDVIILKENQTMRQAMERMEVHRYSSVPVIDDAGRYAGTITEGDLLWKMKNTPGLDFESCSKIPLSDVPRHVRYSTVNIDADLYTLLDSAATQNFVPVIDDSGIFIGIVRRRDVIGYCRKMLETCKGVCSEKFNNAKSLKDFKDESLLY